MISIFIKYAKVWYLMTINSFSSVAISRMGAMLFLIGKILRFLFFLIFLFLLTSATSALAGYQQNQVILFYLTFNLVDTTTQFLFREVYRFRRMIVSGDFDLVLVKPISPLFRSLMGGSDPLDLIMLFPFIGAIVFIGKSFDPTIQNIFVYILLMSGSLIIAASFHIVVLALGIITTEIDHAIMIYRDISSTGRVPIDIYKEPLRGFLTFVIPVGIMMTFPVKAFFGLLSPFFIALTMVMSGFSLWLSLKFWNYALSQYTSASS